MTGELGIFNYDFTEDTDMQYINMRGSKVHMIQFKEENADL